MKNQLKSLVLAFITLNAGHAFALETFECVRDLIPITEQAAFQSKRKQVEKPFMASEKYMAFPQVIKDAVTGFFLYSSGHAWYYDSVESADPSVIETPRSIADLKRTNQFTLFNLVVQPTGLETVTLQYMPGFGNNETTQGGPVILGSSLMPVVGAFMSRTNEQLAVVFRNPREVDNDDLKRWVYEHLSRKPAAEGDITIEHQLLHLATRKELTKAELWRPMMDELKLRKVWVQNHNLDEDTFKKFSRIMETTCK